MTSRSLEPPKGLLSLIGVMQQNMLKMCPIMDDVELNLCVAYTADAHACVSKLREWKCKGSNIILLDLRSAYLQVRIKERPLIIPNCYLSRQKVLTDQIWAEGCTPSPPQ